MNEWQVEIRDHPGTFTKDVWIFSRVPQGVQVLQRDMQTVKTINIGEAPSPTIEFLPAEIFQALVDAIHGKYKPAEGKFTEGKLEATERHLADMRQLLKLK